MPELNSLVTKKGDSSSFESSEGATMSIYFLSTLIIVGVTSGRQVITDIVVIVYFFSGSISLPLSYSTDKSVTTISKVNLPSSVADSEIFRAGAPKVEKS